MNLSFVVLALAVTCLERLAVLCAGCGLAGSRLERDSLAPSRADVVFFHLLLLCFPAEIPQAVDNEHIYSIIEI